VAKGKQTITFPAPPPLRNGDPDCTLGASASSGLPVTYLCSSPQVATLVNGNQLHILGAGKVNITAKQAGDDNWLPSPAVSKSLTIGKRGQTIDFPALAPHTMGDADFAPGATATSGLTVSYASSNTKVAKIVAGKIQLVGKGAAVITASQNGSANWDPATPVAQNLTVAGGTQTIIFLPLPAKGYGNPDFAPPAAATSGLPVAYLSSDPKVATIVKGKIHIVGIGTCVISAQQAGNANWAAAPDVTQPLIVDKGTPILTWVNPAPITYGKPLSSIQLKAKANVPGNFVYTPGSGTVLNAGLHILNVIFTPTDAVRYNTAAISVPLAVNKAAATITLTGLSQPYHGQPHQVTVATVPPGLNVVVTYDPAVPVNAGNYAVVAAVDDPNASGTKSATMQITKANQTINFASLLPMSAGDPDRLLTASAASGLPVTYTSSTQSVVTIVDGNKLHAVATGTAYITANQSGDSNWNPALAVKQRLDVGAAQVTLDIPSYAGLSGTRTYRWTEKGVVDTWSTKVLGTTTANGKQVYFIQEYDENGYENDQSYLLADTSAGLFETGGLNDYGEPTETTWFWNPDLPRLMKTFVLGKEYQVTVSRTGYPGTTFNWKIKTVTEQVTVPFGTFDTYKVTLTINAPASLGGGTQTFTSWYALNLGLIKRYQDGSLWELTGYVP
jgi:hypothetical protein